MLAYVCGVIGLVSAAMTVISDVVSAVIVTVLVVIGIAVSGTLSVVV